LFSNKIAELEEKAKDWQKICELSGVYLDEAEESGEYNELIELAKEKAMKDFKQMKATMDELEKEMKP